MVEPDGGFQHQKNVITFVFEAGYGARNLLRLSQRAVNGVAKLFDHFFQPCVHFPALLGPGYLDAEGRTDVLRLLWCSLRMSDENVRSGLQRLKLSGGSFGPDRPSSLLLPQQPQRINRERAPRGNPGSQQSQQRHSQNNPAPRVARTTLIPNKT